MFGSPNKADNSEFKVEFVRQLGHASIDYDPASAILTRATGFMDTYDYTLNPYKGCAFGCTYCYAAFFSRNKTKMDSWGYWVGVKENAIELLKKKRKRPLRDVVIYMSSVTDPYQPIERKIELTRGILNELADHHDVRLVVQTRSPLVTRDIDLLKAIGRVQVNMTITTDDETVRKQFEPMCPSNQKRLDAISEVHNAGVNSCITLTPLLPVNNAEAFAQALKNTGINRYIVQPFHSTKGKFVAGTRDTALALLRERGWGDEEYQRILKVLQQQLPYLGEGKEGFSPPV